MVGMFAALVTFSLVIMLLERKKNDGHFSEVPPEGHLLHSLWFSALTMMCLEHDVALRLSFVGRLLASMWSFAGILFLTVFTGAAVSAFSSAESNGQVTPLEDLANFRTGAYTGAATERELRKISAPMPPHVANLHWVFKERLFPSLPPEHGLERVLVDVESTSTTLRATCSTRAT